MDYHFKPIGKTCAATGKELVPGEACHSVLVEQHGQYVRLDFSAEGWSGPPEGSIGHWCVTVPAADDAAQKPLDPNALMPYFEQLNEEANPAREKLCYVLALLLLQKKRLKLEGSRRAEDVEYLTLSGSQGEGPFEVRDWQLAEDEIRQLQQELNAHLAGEWS